MVSLDFQSAPQSGSSQQGLALVLVLLLLLTASALVLSLMFVTETELRVSTDYDDHSRALLAAEAGINEVLFRLRMKHDSNLAPISGSKIAGLSLPGPDDGYLNPDGDSGNCIAAHPNQYDKCYPLVSVLVNDGQNWPSKFVGEGNLDDDDLDNLEDEVDELNLIRDWRVDLVEAASYNASLQEWDTDPDNISSPTGAETGNQLVLPALMRSQDLTSQAADTKSKVTVAYTITESEYTTNGCASQPPGQRTGICADLLQIRFLRDRDFDSFCCSTPPKLCCHNNKADFNDNGVSDLIYYDSRLNQDLSPNNWNSIDMGTSAADDESNYNYDRSCTGPPPCNYTPCNTGPTPPTGTCRGSGGTGATIGTGAPVIVVQATGRVLRDGKEVARRRLELRAYYKMNETNSSALCICQNLTVSGGSEYHSYDSLENTAGVPDCQANYKYPLVLPEDAACNSSTFNGSTQYKADLSTNGTLDIGGSAKVAGDLRAKVVTANGGSIWGDAIGKNSVQCGGVGAYCDKNSPYPTCINVGAAGRCFPYYGAYEDPCLCDDFYNTICTVKLLNNCGPGKNEACNSMLVTGSVLPANNKAWNVPVEGPTATGNCTPANGLTYNGLYSPGTGVFTAPNPLSSGNPPMVMWFKGGGRYYMKQLNVNADANNGTSVRFLVGKHGPNGKNGLWENCTNDDLCSTNPGAGVGPLEGYDKCIVPAVDRPSRPALFYIDEYFAWSNSPQRHHQLFKYVPPADYAIFYNGKGTNCPSGFSGTGATAGSLTPQSFSLGASKNYFVNIIAPNAIVDFGGSSTVVGSIVANSIQNGSLTGGTHFHYDRRLLDFFTGTSKPAFAPGGWHEIE